MSHGQMLPGPMSIWHLETVQHGPRNLHLKFCQNRFSNSWDITDIEFSVVVVLPLGYVRLSWGWVGVLTISDLQQKHTYIVRLHSYINQHEFWVSSVILAKNLSSLISTWRNTKIVVGMLLVLSPCEECGKKLASKKLVATNTYPPVKVYCSAVVISVDYTTQCQCDLASSALVVSYQALATSQVIQPPTRVGWWLDYLKIKLTQSAQLSWRWS